jgi:hypothetical protein
MAALDSFSDFDEEWPSIQTRAQSEPISNWTTGRRDPTARH